MMSRRNEILWLSIIQGWAILLVLIGHVNAFTYSGVEGEMYPMAEWIHRFCYAFHMPLFMFVSGGLLYMSRIAGGWKTGPLYLDKLKRLLLPYIAFTLIGFLIKIPVAHLCKTGMDMSIHGVLAALFDPGTGPLKELWFLGTLMWLMLMYPLYRVMLRNPYTEVILLIITLIPWVLGLKVNIQGYFNLAGIFDFAVYFVGGMLFFKYNCIAFFKRNVYAVIGVTLLFITMFLTGIGGKLLTALFGILMSFALGSRVAERFPGTFKTFRDHSFQIYLVGIFPQMVVELMVWTKVHDARLQLPFYMVSIAAALTAGVVLSRLGSKIKVPAIRWMLGLK